jgi:glutamine amidotransferase
MIGVIDYGVGNVQAFLNVYSRLGIPSCRVTNTKTLNEATHLVLPGVGHFDHAMTKLDESGMREYLSELVLEHNVPILGVCVGMQMISNGSEEGALPGLGWVPGYVRRFNFSAQNEDLPLPHMGWNSLKIPQKSVLFDGLESNDIRFYFLHSYYFEPEEGTEVHATAKYGIDFASVVAKGNIFGMQCHPEKSHESGERFLRNFGEL